MANVCINSSIPEAGNCVAGPGHGHASCEANVGDTPPMVHAWRYR